MKTIKETNCRAQCFAYLILEGYVKKHVLTHEEFKEALSINYQLIEKTDEDWEIKQKTFEDDQ
ncbi:hypothetical protein AB3G27_12740 [Bacillus pumilus]|uniref:hypothetical protein n=1 Tax=Bacillus pumilus TaxID=1408 RepID=UPI0034A25EFA